MAPLTGADGSHTIGSGTCSYIKKPHSLAAIGKTIKLALQRSPLGDPSLSEYGITQEAEERRRHCLNHFATARKSAKDSWRYSYAAIYMRNVPIDEDLVLLPFRIWNKLKIIV